jgi:hypothetical protein
VSGIEANVLVVAIMFHLNKYVMKKKMIPLCFMIFSFVAVEAQKINVPYDYPIKPGMESWRKFNSQAEMIAACQIPQDVLKQLSTAALVETCLNYPLFSQVVLYNSLQDGFSRFANKFNGFKELLSRSDAPALLLERYKKMDPSGYSQSWPLVQKGQFIYSYLFIEILLAQDEIISKLNPNVKKELARETVKKFDAKAKEKELFGLVGLSHTSFVMSKTLSLEKHAAYKTLRDQNKSVAHLQETAQTTDFETLLGIRNLTESYSR